VVRLVLVPALMAMFSKWNWWLPGWLGRLLPSVDFDRPLPDVDLGGVVVIPEDITAAIAPSADLRVVIKSAAKLKHLAPDAICVTDPLAFSGCARKDEPESAATGPVGKASLAYRSGIARAMSWADRPIHPVTLWRGRLAVALDALDSRGTRNGFRRSSPVETTNVQLPTGDRLLIPTGAETLRFKGYLIMSRNSSRDYADFADMVDAMDPETVAVVLAGMDRYYCCQPPGSSSRSQWMATQLLRRLADPDPSDLDDDWPEPDGRADWEQVRQRCLAVAVAMLEEAR
jgi:RND superfamily putative drug exporter